MKKDYNKETDPERKIFQAALGSMTIQPSEKFWNSALNGIINKGDAQSRRLARTWKYVAFGMGGVIVLFCVHDVFMYNKIDTIEQQNTEIVSLQKKLVELESKPANAAVATTPGNSNNESNSASNSVSNTSQVTAKQITTTPANAAIANNTVAWHHINNNVASNTDALDKDIVAKTTKPSSIVVNTIASAQQQSGQGNVFNVVENSKSSNAPAVINETSQAVVNNNYGSTPEKEVSLKNQSATNGEGNQINTEQENNKKDAVKLARADSAANLGKVADSINSIPAAVAQATKKSFSLKHKGSVGAFFAPGALNDFYEDRDNDMADNITPNTVKARQSDWFSYEAGVNVGFDISKKLTIHTGVYYDAYSYNIKQTVVKAESEENGQLGYSIVTSSGLVNIPYTASTIKPGDSIKVHGSSSRGYVCIPLQLTYTFFTHYKLGFFADAGIAANIAASTSTELDWQNTLLQAGTVNITSIEGLQQIHYSYHLGIGATYMLFHGLSVNVEPILQGSVTPISKNTPIETYPFFLGCSLGVSYHF